MQSDDFFYVFSREDAEIQFCSNSCLCGVNKLSDYGHVNWYVIGLLGLIYWQFIASVTV